MFSILFLTILFLCPKPNEKNANVSTALPKPPKREERKPKTTQNVRHDAIHPGGGPSFRQKTNHHSTDQNELPTRSSERRPQRKGLPVMKKTSASRKCFGGRSYTRVRSKVTDFRMNSGRATTSKYSGTDTRKHATFITIFL